MSFDRDKFRSLVLYVIWRTGDTPGFGATKLNKVLWFAEARTFEAHGRPIAGETFIREKFGPVPQHIKPVLNELIESGAVQMWVEPYYEFEIHRYRAHEPPDHSVFSPEELSFIDWWIKHIAEEHTASSISEKSHDYGWQVAGMGEELPLHAFLARRLRQPTEDDLEWVRNAKRSPGTQ